MAENRRDILSYLKTLLESVVGVTTVVRTFKDIDITNYNENELSLIQIKEPSESSKEEMTSMRAIQDLEVQLKIFFVVWGENPTTAYETLTKNIRDKIGNDFKLGNYAIKILIEDISLIDGEIPLYWYFINLDIEYYLNQRNV